MVQTTRRVFRAASAAALVLAALAAPARADFEERRVLRAEQLLVRNLIGTVRVEGHSGADFEVLVAVRGRDATPARVHVDVGEGTYAELIVEFPLDESRRYVYPALGHSRSRFDAPGAGDAGWLSRMLGSSRGRIDVSDSGGGLELWADVTVRAPAGAAVRVEHGAGKVSASELDGSVELDSRAGAIDVSDVRGRVLADTGSGRVRIAGVRGDVIADTGSGGVELRDCVGDRIVVDTGSGAVVVESVEAEHLGVDTGSGGIRARDVATDGLVFDTGSGAVTLELRRMGTGRFVIDTGSGGITLRLPTDASADLRAEAGSGGVRLDLARRARVRQSERDEAEATLGDGEARVRLSTGSGGIRVSQ